MHLNTHIYIYICIYIIIYISNIPPGYTLTGHRTHLVLVHQHRCRVAMGGLHIYHLLLWAIRDAKATSKVHQFNGDSKFFLDHEN